MCHVMRFMLCFNKYNIDYIVKVYIYIYIYIYIQSWPKISAPLVNMIKEVCENESALLILLIFYLKKFTKCNLSLDNNNLKWGEISL